MTSAIFEPLPGSGWRHVKRRTTYEVVGVAANLSPGLADGDRAEAYRFEDRIVVCREGDPIAQKGGVRIGVAEVQAAVPCSAGDRLVLYRSDDNLSIWLRPLAEFLDGRFEALSDSGGRTVDLLAAIDLLEGLDEGPLADRLRELDPRLGRAEAKAIERTAQAAIRDAKRRLLAGLRALAK